MTGMEWGEVQGVYLLCPPSPARGDGAGIGDDTPHARRLSRAAFAPPLLRRGQIAALRDALAQYPPPPPPAQHATANDGGSGDEGPGGAPGPLMTP